MSMNIDEASSKLYEYLLEKVGLSSEELMAIKSSSRLVREISPTDLPLVFKRIEILIAAAEDLSWVISVVNRKYSQIKRKSKEIRDPEYVMLVRQGRPSSAAIESEIRFVKKELYEMDEDSEILKNIIDYLEHLSQSLEKYQWMLRDKIKAQ